MTEKFVIILFADKLDKYLCKRRILMENREVIFCYYDKEENMIKEVLGHLSYFDEVSFVNEIYYMKLDSTYSNNVFFKPGYTTGNLLSVFKPKHGIIDLHLMADIVCDFSFCNERAKRVIQSYLEKIKIDEIRRFDFLEYDDIVRNSSNPIFLQPFTHHRVMAESWAVEANTFACDLVEYHFEDVSKARKKEPNMQRGILC